MRLAYTLVFALALTGCATKGLYEWGGYSSTLYNTYKDPATTAAGIVQLQTHIGQLEQGRQKVPPGLYADLGMLQLQAGDKEQAQANFRKERDTWPESAGLMNALINNGTMPKAKEGTS